MGAKDVLRSLGESLGSTATVKSVFGEPVHSNGKTVVPVAKIAYGFGGGFGSGRSSSQADDAGPGGGGGGGGGVTAFPVGVLEITATDTRFVPFIDMRLLVAAFTAGAVVGGWLWRPKRELKD